MPASFSQVCCFCFVLYTQHIKLRHLNLNKPVKGDGVSPVTQVILKINKQYILDALLFPPGDMDLVRCFHCGIGLKDFSDNDIPLNWHVKYSPKCEHLIHILGSQEAVNTRKASY